MHNVGAVEAAAAARAWVVAASVAAVVVACPDRVVRLGC